jgi:hypothetical protein
MKAGTIVRLPDGREGTFVYNGLDGRGIKWGRHVIPPEGIGGDSGLFRNSPKPPPDFDLFPDAMLREPYPTAELPCVGEEFEIMEIPA